MAICINTVPAVSVEIRVSNCPPPPPSLQSQHPQTPVMAQRHRKQVKVGTSKQANVSKPSLAKRFPSVSKSRKNTSLASWMLKQRILLSFLFFVTLINTPHLGRT